MLDLAGDDPRKDVPKLVAEACQRAIQQGRIGYAADAGLLDLRVAIARHLSLLSGGRPVNADNIVISNGARESMFGACFTLFDSTDEVLIPTPTWHSIGQAVRLSRARPVRVAGEIEWSFKVGVDQLNRVATADTAGVILCTPVNPTGAVYTRAELKAIVQWALERGCWGISDEVSRRVHFGSGPAPSVLDLPDEMLERVVVIGGGSKEFGMSGWRLGFSLAPHTVVRSLTALQYHTSGGASLPVQWAGVTAYSDERVEVDFERSLEEIRHNRDLAVAHFRELLPEFEFVDPLGGVHLLFRVDGCFQGEADSAPTFCERLLTEKSVLLVVAPSAGKAH